MGGKQSASLFEGARSSSNKDFSKKARRGGPHVRIPSKGTPNSTYIKKDDKGNTTTIRHYNNGGLAEYDIDYTDHGNPKNHKVPHTHNWDWSDPSHPVRKGGQ
jgi:hypothetical protein